MIYNRTGRSGEESVSTGVSSMHRPARAMLHADLPWQNFAIASFIARRFLPSRVVSYLLL